jgi:hypothetical protein
MPSCKHRSHNEVDRLEGHLNRALRSTSSRRYRLLLPAKCSIPPSYEAGRRGGFIAAGSPVPEGDATLRASIPDAKTGARSRVPASRSERGATAVESESAGRVRRDGLKVGGEASGARRGEPRCLDIPPEFVSATTARAFTPKSPTRSSPSWRPVVYRGAAVGDGGDQGSARDAAQRLDAARLFRPQGARLIGSYDSQVAFGQSRVLLVWTRLILPNGRSIIRALRRGAGDTLNQTGQQVARRNLNMQPTLKIRPGFPVRVIVNRDLVLEPYRV